MSDEAQTILGATPLANGQINYVVQNEFNDAITAVTQETVAVDLTSADVSYTAAQWQIGGSFVGGFLFSASGNSVYRTITVPEVKRVFAIYNGGSAVLGVVNGTAVFLVFPSDTQIFYTDGSTDGLQRIAPNHNTIVMVEDHTLTAPPSTPAVGANYVVGSSATGSWAGEDKNLATHIGSDAYLFTVPYDSQIVRSKDLSGSATSFLINYNLTNDSWDVV